MGIKSAGFVDFAHQEGIDNPCGHAWFPAKCFQGMFAYCGFRYFFLAATCVKCAIMCHLRPPNCIFYMTTVAGLVPLRSLCCKLDIECERFVTYVLLA